MKRFTVGLAILGLALLTNLNINAATWELDQAHSEVRFKIRHLVSKTAGRFTDFSGSIEFDEKNPLKMQADATIKTPSVNTDNEKRDEHLRNEDFFNVAKYPTMTFKSTGAKKDKDGNMKLMGDLTLLGVTKPVVLNVEIGGVGPDPWGNTRAGFSASTKISRKDFGMTYNIPLDKGGLVLGDEVEINLEVEAIQKK